MRWRIALVSELLAGFNESNPKNFLPQPIDGDSCRKRVIGMRDPFGQFEPIQFNSDRRRIEHRRNCRRDNISSVPVVTSKCDMSFPLADFFHHQGRSAEIRKFCLRLRRGPPLNQSSLSKGSDDE